MAEISYDHAAVPVREALTAAHARAWRRLAAPGTWLTGAERVAVMAEVRQAPHCALCRERKAALSPYAVDGAHDHLGALPDVQVEVIHRVLSDPARLTPGWFAGVIGDGFADWVKLQIEVRNQQCIEQSNLMIAMDPEVAAVFKASTKLSCKCSFRHLF